MSKYKRYGKGWFKEPRRHALSAKGIKTGRKSYARQPLGDVWKLETPKEDIYSDRLSSISERAIKGDRKAQNFLRKLWDNESWSSIKKKLETEGSVWYVWWMDGVRTLMSKKGVNYQRRPLPPQHISQAPLPDKDKDKVPDIYDWDDDNDGVPDWKDTEGMFSVDSFKGKGVFDPFYESQVDSDFDGVPDVKDLHPRNPHKARDWAKRERDLRKWFYGKNAKSIATKEAKIRSEKSGKKYLIRKTIGGGYWVGTKEQEKRMHWAKKEKFDREGTIELIQRDTYPESQNKIVEGTFGYEEDFQDALSDELHKWSKKDLLEFYKKHRFK